MSGPVRGSVDGVVLRVRGRPSGGRPRAIRPGQPERTPCSADAPLGASQAAHAHARPSAPRRPGRLVGAMACRDAESLAGGDATRFQRGEVIDPSSPTVARVRRRRPCHEPCKAVPIPEEFQAIPGAGESSPALPEFGLGEKDFLLLSWASGVDGRLERGVVLAHRERFAFTSARNSSWDQSVDGFVDLLAPFYRCERRVVGPHPVHGAVAVGELVTAEAGERAGQLPELVADLESEGDAEPVVVHQPEVGDAGDGSLSEQGITDDRVGLRVGRDRVAEVSIPA